MSLLPTRTGNLQLPSIDPSAQIRVLVVEAGELDSPLVLHFQVYDVKEHVEANWEAISYSWDGQQPSENLVVDGVHLVVSCNVIDILNDLRHQTTRRQLWIDAVCIAQDDPQEKSLQVALMGTIYSKAKRVTIWLNTKHMEEAVTAIFAANDWMRTIQLEMMFSSTLNTSKSLMSLFIDHHPNQPWRSPLHHILALNWFQRIWVLQEGVLARALQISLGREVMSWSDFAAIVLRFLTMLPVNQVLQMSLEECHRITLDKNFSAELRQGLSMIYRIESLRHLRQNADLPTPSELVYLASDRKASVASDKVYALAGLFGRDPGSAMQNSFPIDYRKDSADVYKDFALWCIEYEGNLDILAQQYHRPDRTDITGWVTDWSVTGQVGVNLTGSGPLTSRMNQDRVLLSVTPPNCRRLSSETLAVRGFMIDTIGGDPSDEADPPYVIGGALGDDDRLRRWCNRIPADTNANTLLFGEPRPSLQTLDRYFHDAYEKYIHFSHLWREGDTSRIVVRQRSPQGYWGYLTKRGCLCLTVGYLDASTPFKLCYLNGGRGLFVLRPNDATGPAGEPRYSIVTGDCFIDGFQDGAGFEMAQRLGLAEQDIYLV